ncbi:CPBP family intramembrane metalloprotease [bacterium]|nr:CPBP family intramembrane metalloprotease [bacterium]
MKKYDLLKLILFFVITFVFSWFFWLIEPGNNALFLAIGTFGPTITALTLTIVYEGLAGTRSILSSLVRWKVRYYWYIIIFGSTFLIPLLAILIFAFQGGTVIQTNDPRQWYLIIPAFFQILFLSVLGEEIGWRGFALPLMQEVLSPFISSIVLGLIWGAWHLPLFWTKGNFHSQIPFSLFMLQSVALTIVMTWLFNRTCKSLFTVHIFHAASKTFLGVLPIMPENTRGDIGPLWIAVGLLWLFTIVIMILDRKRFYFVPPKSTHA